MSYNILVTAAGSIVSQGIMKCLKFANNQNKNNIQYKIITTDKSPQAAGLYRSNLGILVPPASSSEYIDFIIKKCLENKIKALFIGSDEELVPLTLAKDYIENKTGTVIITNSLKVTNIAVDKWETFLFLQQNGFPCPDTSLPDGADMFIEKHGFPIVVKPREGHGSLHFYVVHEKNELENATRIIRNHGWNPILQEYLNGEDTEFTSGITRSSKGKVMSSISMRKFLKNGQTYKAFIDDFIDVRKSSEKIAEKIDAEGPINIQAKMVDGIPKVFEINGRISATCPLRAVAGINEPDILFRNKILDEDIEIKEYQRLVCFRYWNEMYIPYSTYEETEKQGFIKDSDSLIPDYF
jgi:carbamoyl-phosphate synthase large subunit